MKNDFVSNQIWTELKDTVRIRKKEDFEIKLVLYENQK